MKRFTIALATVAGLGLLIGSAQAETKKIIIKRSHPDHAVVIKRSHPRHVVVLERRHHRHNAVVVIRHRHHPHHAKVVVKEESR